MTAVVGFLALALIDLVPFHSVALKRITYLATIVVFGAALWLIVPATPALSAVNGTYRNSCCGPVTLQDGVLVAPDFRTPFKLHMEKYGLMARIDRRIAVRSGKIVLSGTPGTSEILFSDDRRGFTLCAHGCGVGNEFELRRE
jgi:hypothetical protein